MSESCSSSLATCADDSEFSSSGGNNAAEPVPPDEPAQTGCQVRLDLRTADVRPPLAGWLDRQLARIAALAGLSGGQINLVVVDDRFMRNLHQRYLGASTVTDVLTFDLRDAAQAWPADPEAPDGVDRVDADVVICLEEARRQARRRGHDTRTEALLYAVHGMLHLLGERDQDPHGARRMHQREDELLSEAGIGPVFTTNSRCGPTSSRDRKSRSGVRSGENRR